ncbi:UNVERIFIED_CONTAM: putative disease resistance protein RGA1 [Sesamum calycinum]|uniref:Disease resistance protein RGA1 n=1 Tax=Sesamum calycinum TaxID=2727403 RepID=A0AAW2N322_9LAMI
MAETFLFNITDRVLGRFSSIALEHITSTWNTKSEVQKLQNTLSTIRAVILDADGQQAKKHEVRDWLEKLKDAVYEIDDLLDDLSTQVSQRNVEICSGILILKKVRRFFSSSNPIACRFKIAQRVKGLRQRLDEIADDRAKFHFSEQAHFIPVDNNVKEQTHSFVRASDIIGRDDDKENIVQLLLSSKDEEDVSVIPVVGIGGLGKTTVVKLAYNDDRVVQSFDLGMWVSVSEDFGVVKVVEKILKSATGENLAHLDMDQMQSRLAGVLNNKKYLLVLDDVWNEDRNKWMDLRELLMNGRTGSKIIVTTRSKAVALITGTTSPYNLAGLSDDDCLSLFLKCAFRGPENWLPNLVAIAKEIVKKCGGVPLAVKTLGGLLYMNTDEQEWLHIKNNDIWEIDQKQSDILPILRLSYEKLPPHLRQCFAYCSMLPKGFEIPREVFINLWIAQGLVSSASGNRELEDIGNQYFNELLARFCFQEVVEAFDGEILVCRIHNLVHDLAQSVAGDESLNVKADIKSISDRVRHLYLHDDDLSVKEAPKMLFRLKNLRSFRCTFKNKPLDMIFIQGIAMKFRRLRVLVLQALDLEELPSSIGGLQQLRFAWKLQKFSQHQNLVFDLPGDISDKEKSPKLQFSPVLAALQLRLCSVTIRRIQNLNSLRVLRIYDCPRLASLPDNIKYLTALEKLWIWNCEVLDLSDGDGLEGLTSLESLLLMGLPKLINLPMGLTENVAKTLKFFRIANCANFAMLPEWLLTFNLLQRLYVEDCPNLSFLPQEVGSHIAKVHVSGCPKLGKV